MQFCPQKIEWPPFILIIYVDMWFENSSLLQKGKNMIILELLIMYLKDMN